MLAKKDFLDPPPSDYEEHAATYRTFLVVLKWAVIHVFVILALMAWFLT